MLFAMTDDQCSATFTLSPEECTWLDALPDAPQLSEPDHCCNLDPGHPSDHVSFVQSQDYGDNETLISWWVWWSEAGHSLSARKECEVERLSQNLDADLCLLPTGHWGRHAYVSSGPGGEEIRIA